MSPGASAAASPAASSITVEAPATSANLGSGFDALALALELANRVTVEPAEDAGVQLEVDGEGADSLAADDENRFLVAFQRGLADAGPRKGPFAGGGWSVRMENAIPLARGLGSSAAATVAGLVAADRLLGGALGRRRILELASVIEGHPDNAAAALEGGFVLAVEVRGRLETVRFEPPADLRTVVFVPRLRLSTADMRSLLPSSVPRTDAVHNVAASAAAVAAFATGRLELLALATDDRLHEPYRAAAFPELPALVAAARGAGALGACLSGAGSTVIAFVRAETEAAVSGALVEAAAARALPGSVRLLTPRSAGARIL